MKLVSRSLSEGKPVPQANAMGVPGPGGPVPGPNKSPHLAWSEFPAGTKSFAVICVDIDAPARPDDANKSDRTIPYDFPRADFCHWLLADIPPSTTELPEGVDSDGLVPHGKPPHQTHHGFRGINDYKEWFEGDLAMSGDYGGYDGPWPPFNDERLHRYVFTVYALSVPALGLAQKYRAKDALEKIKDVVLDQATITATYSLNPTAR